MKTLQRRPVAPAERAAESPPPGRATSRVLPQLGRVGRALWGLVRFVGALVLFVGALQLMKTGAASLDFLQNQGMLVRNAGATLGLGWIGALFVLSGSPMAASALTLVAGGAISEVQGFTMLTGSRLGAAFVVLVVAVVYALRGGEGERRRPVSTGVMALSTTALVYVPAAAIGYGILSWGPFASLEIAFPHQFTDVIDLVYGGLIARVEAWSPALIFLAGLGCLLVSFKLIDSVMPELNEQKLGKRATWVQRKWPMFALGSLVALVTMSVSVALTVLVPLVSKRYVKREDIIPYIMGANITTLGDTMLAAFALQSPAAVRIVLAEVIAASIVSVLLLGFFYLPVRRIIWRFQRQMLVNRPRLAVFTACLFVVPVGVIGISNLVA
jgi:sodium-dependent phosphate cotransporter